MDLLDDVEWLIQSKSEEKFLSDWYSETTIILIFLSDHWKIKD